MSTSYLNSAIQQFRYYKLLGERTLDQVSDEDLFWQYNAESNSLAVLVKHLWGNMLSRWTDFLDSDGEKEFRQREAEFDNDLEDRANVLLKWNAGWDCLFQALEGLTEADLEKIVYIRNMGHTVTEAINRQLAHYSYHIGQMVYLGRMIRGQEWESLSIPRGGTAAYNADKFQQEKRREHFTKEKLDPFSDK
ncbi:MAG: DUF1572 family protein [Saprospiraceae bacterium]|nr:DUF1572 family protein [Saprospiraceae bacterium]